MSNGQNGATIRSSSYIQFGCGLCAPVTWRNFDAGPAFWIERNLPVLKPTLLKRGYPDYPSNIEYGNVIKGLPVAPASAAAAYCSHVLEHLALDEFRSTLRNVFTYLQPGGPSASYCRIWRRWYAPMPTHPTPRRRACSCATPTWASTRRVKGCHAC